MNRKLLLALVPLALLSQKPLSAAESAETENTASIPTTTAPPAEKSNQDDDAVIKKQKKQGDIFIPSEEISEDFAVSFPVDI
ncbi:MAG: hypothetical protein AAF529_10980 [Pseudomonadota bacterium]